MRIRLTLLGGVGARLPSGELLHLPSRKGQALLAYLALRPGLAHPREKLAAFLWGDVPGERARHSLRQALVALRAAVAPAEPALLIEKGDTVAVNPKTLDVDVVAFERAMAEGTPEGFERASALYQGELLEGIDVDEPPFEEWLVSERARLRELAVEAMAKLLAHQVTAAPVEAAVQTAVRLVGLEPSQEEVHRTLMRLYIRQGRRGAALAQYQICVGVLQRELGTEPESATRQLYQTILSSRPSSLVTDAAPAAAGAGEGVESTESGPTDLAPPVLVSEMPFLGREAELQALTAALDDARQGRGRVVVIVGEAGIGKTRLVSEAVAEASRSGHRILLGRAYESSQGFPFDPWMDALRSGGVIRDLQRSGDTNEPWRRELARLFPELGVTDPFVVLGQESIAKLFEAFAHILESLVTRQPMTLVLEDLHWADETSLRLFSAVGRRLADRRVLIVATARAEEVMVSPALRRALAELTREGRIVQLTLPPLSQPDTLALVRLLVGTGVEHVGEQVWRLTEGNPLAIVETVRTAQREAPATGAPLSLSPLIAEAIGDRLDRLGERARQLATVAAVVGRTFEFELLRRAGGLDTEEAAEGVEELVGRRVLHVVGEHLDFTHDRVREVAYARVLPPRRQLLHAAVGDALEVLYAGRLDEVCDRLAFHYSRSERTDKAVRYLAHSAERAARAYAYAEAAAVLDEGIRQAERLVGEDRDRWVVDLALRRSFSLTFLGRWRDTLDLLVPHRAKVERLADPALASAYFFRIGMCHYYLGDQPEAFRHGQRALAEASHCSDPAHAGRAHHLLGLAAYYAGRFGEGAEHGRHAVGFLERTQEAHWLGLAYYLRSINLAFLGEFEAALEIAGRLERLAAGVDDPRLACWGPYVSGVSHTIRGDSQAGIRDLQRAVDAAREPITIALVTARLGWAYLESGDEARAAPLLEAAIALLEQVRYRSIVAQTTAFLAEARLRGGDMEDAKTLATRALAAATEAAYPYGIASAHRALGRIAAAAEEVDAARHHLAEAGTLFAEMPAPVDQGWVSLALADLAGRHAEPTAAAVHLADAYRSFRAFRIVSGLEGTRALAEELGLPLPRTDRRPTARRDPPSAPSPRAAR